MRSRTPRRSARFVVALVSSIVLAADGQPPAHGDADVYDHPLNNDAARAEYAEALAAHPGWTDEQVLALFEIAEVTSQETEEGEATVWTGLRPVEREALTREEADAQRTRGRGADVVGPRFSEDWESATRAGQGTVHAVLSFRMPEDDLPLTRRVAVAVVRGDVRTWGDYRNVRAAWEADRREARRAVVEQRAESLASGGVVVDWVDDFTGQIGVHGSAGQVAAVDAATDLTFAEVTRDDFSREIEADAGYAIDVVGVPLNGRELEDLIQSTDFYTRGDGAVDMPLGMVDSGPEVWRMHPGFDDLTGVDRVSNCKSPS